VCVCVCVSPHNSTPRPHQRQHPHHIIPHERDTHSQDKRARQKKQVVATGLSKAATENIVHRAIDSSQDRNLRHSRAAITALRLHGAPLVLLKIVWILMISNGGYVEEHLDSLESFAGRKAVTRAFKAEGYCSIAYELEDDVENYDILSDRGFATLVFLVLSLRRGGFKLAAPVCSTWTWINRFTSGRSKSVPLGDLTKKQILAANCMVSRVVLITMMCIWKKVFVIVEQPCLSLLQEHPRFAALCRNFRIFRASIQMANYGLSEPVVVCCCVLLCVVVF
jgi:hypothetical protein